MLQIIIFHYLLSHRVEAAGKWFRDPMSPVAPYQLRKKRAPSPVAWRLQDQESGDAVTLRTFFVGLLNVIIIFRTK